jgi:hypothetical protein
LRRLTAAAFTLLLASSLFDEFAADFEGLLDGLAVGS